MPILATVRILLDERWVAPIEEQRHDQVVGATLPRGSGTVHAQLGARILSQERSVAERLSSLFPLALDASLREQRLPVR